ncbi:MAG: RHS repeat-associated core domain-containing protein, partial [Oscillospiraceae bacterium]|nr:RHS repeat-associated core domain-containing protein [Oscillospiraceae bacterium]
DFRYDNVGFPYALHYTDTFEGIEQTYYYITNLQGDVMYMVDEGGDEVASYDYDPYGKLIYSTGSMAETNPIRYRGYYYDIDTGFYYLQSRYYDPATCRFINMDSYVSTGQGFLGYNAFAYCGNNPIIRKDPTGTDAIILCNEGFIGHVGALVQDENGAWWHFYWGAESGSGLNSSSAMSACIVGTDVPARIWCLEYTESVVNLDAINNAEQYGGEYDAMYRLHGDFSTCVDQMKNITGDYNLYRNNCVQVTLRILATANTSYDDMLNEAAKRFAPTLVSKYLGKNLPDPPKARGGGGCRKVMCLY